MFSSRSAATILDGNDHDEATEQTLKTWEGRIHQEFIDLGVQVQLKRDAEVWLRTLQSPGDKRIGDLLRRLFKVIRYGGLQYREKASCSDKWKTWTSTGMNVATVLSHGGRVMIQLPRVAAPKKQYFSLFAFKSTNEETSNDQGFWNWLITGDISGKLLDNHVSVEVSGGEAAMENKILFKRLGATHSLSYVEDEDLAETLLAGRKKYICEQKTCGINPRDTKVLLNKGTTLKKHRHWGMFVQLTCS